VAIAPVSEPGSNVKLDFPLERGYVVETVAARDVVGEDIAPPPLAQHTAHVFPRHARHGRQIGVADLFFEHDASLAGKRQLM
jgi:hypothetical protein